MTYKKNIVNCKLLVCFEVASDY